MRTVVSVVACIVPCPMVGYGGNWLIVSEACSRFLSFLKFCFLESFKNATTLIINSTALPVRRRQKKRGFSRFQNAYKTQLKYHHTHR